MHPGGQELNFYRAGGSAVFNLWGLAGILYSGTVTTEEKVVKI